MFMDWLKKAPTAVTVAVIITCGLLVAVLIGAFVVLEIEGADTAEFRQWVNTIGTLVVFPLLGINTVASLQSARSASRAEDQTNGQLTARDEQIAALQSEVQRLERRNGGLR